jgi:uncharacterized RDD family membrane protein YckC
MENTDELKFSLDGQHRVLTPEYVEFTYTLAGRFSRFLALALDTVITTALTILVALAALAVTAVLSLAVKGSGFGASFFFIAQFFIDWGYMLFFEWMWNGQTIGKRALGLRVIQESGVRVGGYASLLRNLVRPIDKLPLFYLVGGLFSLLSRRQQRLGDVLAGTIVVQESKLRIPANLLRGAELGAVVNDAQFLAQVSKLSLQEEELILAAAFRREELNLKARLTLFSAMSQHLQDDLHLYKPTHLSDEKLVLSIAAAMLERRRSQPSRVKRNAVPTPT